MKGKKEMKGKEKELRENRNTEKEKKGGNK